MPDEKKCDCGCNCDENCDCEQSQDNQQKKKQEYTDDEEKLIKDKLKGLGYLD